MRAGVRLALERAQQLQTRWYMAVTLGQEGLKGKSAWLMYLVSPLHSRSRYGIDSNFCEQKQYGKSMQADHSLNDCVFVASFRSHPSALLSESRAKARGAGQAILVQQLRDLSVLSFFASPTARRARLSSIGNSHCSSSQTVTAGSRSAEFEWTHSLRPLCVLGGVTARTEAARNPRETAYNTKGILCYIALLHGSARRNR